MKTGNVTIIEVEDLVLEYNSGNFDKFGVRDIENISALESINQSDIAIFYDKNVDVSKIIKNRYGSTDQLGLEKLGEMSLITKLKMYWFSRWMATNYEGVLNEQFGTWYLEQMRYFNDNVFPNMIQTEINRDSFESLLEFIKNNY
jgi:hypothetical protein